MFNVCPACGLYSVEKEIRPVDERWAEAVCLTCRHAHRFLRMPLYWVTGASGTGKTRLCLELAARDREFVHLESDILWGAVTAGPEDDYRGYHNTWLRVAKNIGQSGKPVVLYGSAVPSQLEGCPERRYFGKIHCLALVCQPGTLAARLKSRPGWRATDGDAFVESMLSFNRWLMDYAAENLTDSVSFDLLDTSALPLAACVERVREWLS